MSLPDPAPRRTPLRRLPASTWEKQQPTWRDAAPGVIGAALKRALARPSGNWFVLAAAAEVRADRPFGRVIAGTEVVAWRGSDGTVHAAPGACPHLRAPLCRGAVREGRLICRWHGLALDSDLVTADGGRLELAQRRPPVFAIFLSAVPKRLDPNSVLPPGALVVVGRRRRRR